MLTIGSRYYYKTSQNNDKNAIEPLRKNEPAHAIPDKAGWQNKVFL